MGTRREGWGGDKGAKGKEGRSALHMGESNALCTNNSMCGGREPAVTCFRGWRPTGVFP